jgi:hypothetical protein
MKLLYNAEVMRWHIKVAKAAGYTAFLVSVFPGVTFDHATVRARFLTMLQVASEEDFKLGMELWFPLDTSNATYYSHAQGTIDAANASPHASALYKINNLPVVWLVFWSRWDTVSNLTSNLLNTRQAYWVISGDLSFAELNSMTLTNGAQKTQLHEYNFPTLSGCHIKSDLSDRLNTSISNGYDGVSRLLPRFNEAGTFLNERTCLGNDGALLTDWYNENVSGNATMAIIESWNDASEMTQMEPGLDVATWVNYGQETVYSGDPYRPLKQLATPRGLTFTAPALHCSIVDPVLVSSGITICSHDVIDPIGHHHRADFQSDTFD